MLLNNMKRVAIVLLAITINSAWAATENAAQAERAPAPFTAPQKVAIQNIVHDYLLDHPRLLVEVSKKLQSAEQNEMESKARKAIGTHYQSVFFDKNSPVIGNPDGTVTLVEFYDYQCIHCKEEAPVVANLIKDNPNLRVVLKDLPIFGHASRYAALASLASYHASPKFYEAFHLALFKEKGALTEEKTLSIAESVGLNVDALTAAIKDSRFGKYLEDSYTLADQIGISGTPAFIISKTETAQAKSRNTLFFVPGAASQTALQDLITRAEKG